MLDTDPAQDVQTNEDALQTNQEDRASAPPNETEEVPATFKKNWSLAEQHTLERLLSEIPSTVKFRQVPVTFSLLGPLY
jgi:hypothetical protein